MDTVSRDDIVAMFEAWCDGPRHGPRRKTVGTKFRGQSDTLAEIISLTQPAEFADLMLSQAEPWFTRGRRISCLSIGLAAALEAAGRDRESLEKRLAIRAKSEPFTASVLGGALPGGRVWQLLNNETIYDAWSRRERAFSKTFDQQQLAGGEPGSIDTDPAIDRDQWARDVMDNMAFRDPDALWSHFLLYLAHEDDSWLRMMAGISWLESINFRHAAEFIDRIELEAAHNARLREVLRLLYPPRGDRAIERRFVAASHEPTGKAAKRRGRRTDASSMP